MGVVAIDGLLSLTLGRQRVIIMVISMILDFGLWMPNFEFSKSKVGRFQSTMGKQSFLLLWTQPSISLHSKAARLLEYIEEDYIEEELLKKSQI
jgi:hypothetical protein